MRRISQILSVVQLCLLLNFVFCNTVFVHTHSDARGRLITHSHPYLPSSSHTHSSISLDAIASFNLGASSMKTTSYVAFIKATENCRVIYLHFNESKSDVTTSCFNRRGPPLAA